LRCYVNVSVAVTACSGVNTRQQTRVSWVTASSSATINSLSAAAPAADRTKRGYGRRLNQFTIRPTRPAASFNRLAQSINVTPATAAATAVRWKSTYQPSSVGLVVSNVSQTSNVRAVYTARPGQVRHRGHSWPLCHVDPAVKGPCIACEYIRLNTQQRYQPYNAHHHANNASHVVFYY